MSAAPVGVVLVGHGRTASELLQAATGIMGPDAFEGIVAVDAGVGQTPKLSDELCDVIGRVDQGSGVLMLVDLWGSSPCTCAQREAKAKAHTIVTLSGLNLAMLLKVAALDRAALGAQALAQACADSGRRSVQVMVPPDASEPKESEA